MLWLLLGCLPDDIYDTGPDSEPLVDDSGASAEGLVGSWRSEGDDLSPLFAEVFGYERIDAAFKAGGSYRVDARTAEGEVYTFAGIYVVDEADGPARIVLTQSSPSNATAEGIYAVDGDTLTYEVVQTSPDFGFTPPTPQTGFGSTAGEGLEPDANIQVYRRR